MRSYVDASQIQPWSWDVDVLGDAPVQYKITQTIDGNWRWHIVKCGRTLDGKMGLAETESSAVGLADEWIGQTYPCRPKVRLQ